MAGGSHQTDNPQSWFYRGLEAAQRALHEAPSGDPEALAAAACAAADRLIASTPQAGARACAAGCAHCCHYPVGVTEAEAVAIAAALRRRLSPERLDRLRARVRAAASDGASWEELAAARRACVLLDDEQRCSAYEQRPVACRGWSSLSVETCARDHAGEAVAPALDRAAYLIALGVHRGLAGACRDPATHELASALDRALSAPAPGSASFAG